MTWSKYPEIFTTIIDDKEQWSLTLENLELQRVWHFCLKNN